MVGAYGDGWLAQNHCKFVCVHNISSKSMSQPSSFNLPVANRYGSHFKKGAKVGRNRIEWMVPPSPHDEPSPSQTGNEFIRCHPIYKVHIASNTVWLSMPRLPVQAISRSRIKGLNANRVPKRETVYL